MRRQSAVLLTTLVSCAFGAWFVVSTSSPAVADSGGTLVFPYQDRSIVDQPGRWSEDQGVDIADAGKCGADAVLVAVSDGVVVELTDGSAGGFGPWFPVILASDGPFAGRTIYYGHTETPLVTVGQQVVAGQPIAHVGCGRVGISDGPHLEIGVSLPGGSPLPGWGATSHEMLEQLLAAYDSPPSAPPSAPRAPELTDTIGAPYQVASASALSAFGSAPTTPPDPRSNTIDWTKLRLF